jgi:hypothetical protein
MKSFIEYLFEGRKKRKAKRYKGGAAISYQGSGSRSGKAKKYKGGAAISYQGSGSRSHRLNEDEKPKLNYDYGNWSQWVAQRHNDHIAPDYQGVHNALHARYPYEAAPNHPHVYSFTMGSKDLNEELLAHYNNGTTPPNYIAGHHLPSLDQSMGHHKLKHKLDVYSGVTFHPGKLASANEDHIHFPNYLSTTLSKHTAASFTEPLKHDGVTARHILHLHLKKGQQGLYVGKHSSHDQEYEYILHRNQTFKINPKPEIIAPPEGFHTHTFIWHGDPVKSEEK